MTARSGAELRLSMTYSVAVIQASFTGVNVPMPTAAPIRSALLFLLFICMLEACGFKGPLYLPDEQAAPVATSEQGTDTKENKQDDVDKQ